MSSVVLTTPSVRQIAGALIDVFIVLGTLILTLFLQQLSSPYGAEGTLARVAPVIFVILLGLYYNELYSTRAPKSGQELLLRIVKAFVGAWLLLTLLYYLVPSMALGRKVVVGQLLLSVVGVYLWRSLYYWVLAKGAFVERIVVLGTGERAVEVARELLKHEKDGYQVLGFLSTEVRDVGRCLLNPTVIGTFDEVSRLAKEQRVDSVIVAMEDQRGKLPVGSLLECKLRGVRVEQADTYQEMLTGQLPVRSLRPSSIIFSRGFVKSKAYRDLRHALEFVVATVGLVLSAPILVGAALIIWVESSGPILYRQERVGERGKLFTLFKLRTMQHDAEKETGAVWAAADGDPRATFFGRFLRISRIDELPQLFNVVKGEMSFVGPRPERPEFVEQLQALIPYYQERHSVKPGITGWAQVRHGYGGSVEEAETKLRFDLYYIKHMSVWLDLRILLDTAKVMLLGRGAR